MEILSSGPFELVAPWESPRSEGPHVGSIIQYILSTTDPDTYSSVITPRTRQYWEMGFVWEECVADAMARRYLIPKKQIIVQEEIAYEHEGRTIYGTPDGQDIKNWLLHEMKLTRKKAGVDITDQRFRHWLWQIKGYLKIADMDEALLIPCHIMGDYHDPDPVCHRWHLHFNHHEIDNNWDMLMTNLTRMEEDEEWQEKQRQRQQGLST